MRTSLLQDAAVLCQERPGPRAGGHHRPAGRAGGDNSGVWQGTVFTDGSHVIGATVFMPHRYCIHSVVVHLAAYTYDLT